MEENEAISCNLRDQPQTIVSTVDDGSGKFLFPPSFERLRNSLTFIAHELQVVGFLIGVVPFLRNLMIGATAPLRVIEDTASLLG